MSIRNLILGVSSVTVSYLIHYDSLLQNPTDIITKCDNYFIAKCDRSSLQNALGSLIQNATALWQNRTVFTNCNKFITKCDIYYIMRRSLQIATVHLCIIISTFPVVICENTVKQIISERMNEHVKIKLFCFRYLKKNVQKKCSLKFR